MQKAPFCIAHVTDLHVGEHDDLIWEALSRKLNEIDPDLYIVTGDITEANNELHYRLFIDWVKDAISTDAQSKAHGLRLGERYSEKFIVVPGNHDYFVNKAVRIQSGSSLFYNYFPNIKLPEWTYKNKNGQGVFIVQLDSSESLCIANGGIRDSDLESIRKWCDQGRHGKLKKDGCFLGDTSIGSREEAIDAFVNSYKVLVIHHYLFLPRSRDREPQMELKNSGEVLAQITTDDFDLVLSGHDHTNVYDDPSYDHLLDKRAIRRFAQMYCVRQLGVRRPPVYVTDQNGHFLKKSWRLAVDYLRGLTETCEDKFITKVYRIGGLTIDQKVIRRGIRDFIRIDLRDGRLKKVVSRIAELIEKEISRVLNRRNLVNCVAPSAIKEREKYNGFFVYTLNRDRRIGITPYYYCGETRDFVTDESDFRLFSLGNPLNLFTTDAYEVLRSEGVLGPNGEA